VICCMFRNARPPQVLHAFPTRRSSDLQFDRALNYYQQIKASSSSGSDASLDRGIAQATLRKLDHEMSKLDQNAADYAEQLAKLRSEEHTSELQSRSELVCRLLLDKKKT